MKKLNLNGFSFDDLVALRERIDQDIAKRMKTEKSQLKARLARLERIERVSPAAQNGAAASAKPRRNKRGKVPVKYRNPAKRSDTWTGRGRPPRWLAAAMKAGKKKEDFLIARKG